MPVKRKCISCGKEFEVRPYRIKNGGGKYCSIECRRKEWRIKWVKKICEWCGGEYEVIQARDKKTRFCSRKCRDKWFKDSIKGENNPRWAPKIKRHCKYCGKKIEVMPYQIEKGEGKFCSSRCHYLQMSDENIYCQKLGRELERRSIPFEREKPIGRYFADFLIPPNIIIEIDGWRHKAFYEKYDEERDNWLQEQGYKVYRFTTEEIDRDVAGCIGTALKSPAPS